MARSKARGVGNLPRDQQHLAWMEEHGGLEPVDPEAEDIPFPAKTRWSGLSSDKGSPWQIPPEEERCTGRAYIRDADGDYVLDANNERLTRPCFKWPIRGGKVCVSHGGGIVRVRNAAVERMALTLDAASGELARLALGAQDEGTRLSAIKALMDRLGVRTGVEITHMQEPGYMAVLKGIFDQAGVADPGAPNEQ